MRWKETLIGAGAVLAFATACGGQAETASPAAEPSPASQELSKEPADPPADEQKGTPVPAAQINGDELPEGYPVEVAADGRTLTITGQEGGCSKASAEVGEQRGDRVTVTMVQTKPADKNTMCTMDMRYPPVTVRLDQPLEDRMVQLEYAEREE
ncbi:hypothetical protein [Prauserella cavernicola]|uniref:Lipoprotein n=1 Tax=Prauserella cavernicola TaxID=2800127 RepID=A0A934QYC3_9PSEU|nr:hypothetical protein [Prauserella cavernicola]MBK1788706.1 hypothetical protein [Prauserella cavernicola]